VTTAWSPSRLGNLTGKRIIVTGATNGVGLGTARLLARAGAHVILAVRNTELGAQRAAEIGGSTSIAKLDLADLSSVRAFPDQLDGDVDILINNAGTSWGAPVEEMRLEHWNKVIETNLTGTFLFSQAAGKVMIGQRKGKIINIASVAGIHGAPPEFQAIGYHASKGGVIAFTKDLACKWGVHNIQVNAIAPGWFPTNMSKVVIERNKDYFLRRIPLHRFGGDDDLKGAAVYLASSASDYVTGNVLVVDGGQTA